MVFGHTFKPIQHKDFLESQLPEGRGHFSYQCFHPDLIACVENPTCINNKVQGTHWTNGIMLQDWPHLVLQKTLLFLLSSMKEEFCQHFSQSISLYQMPNSSYVSRFLFSVCLYLERISACAIDCNKIILQARGFNRALYHNFEKLCSLQQAE